MRRTALLLLLFVAGIAAKSQVNHLVISQVYGGGGASSGTPSYKYDYVELYNPTTSTVSLNGYSLQYGSASGTGNWGVSALPVDASIAPGKYFLVRQGSGGTAGGDLSISHDATGTLNLAAASGKIALVNTTTALSGACPASSAIVDLLGYGTANCSETSPAATLSNITAAVRKNAGCTDSDNNSSDFSVEAPSLKNSESPANSCSAGGPPSVSINDVSANEGNNGTTLFTFMVSLSAPAPAGGITFDIATADGTATAGTDYVAKSLTSQTIPAGSTGYSFDVVVNGDEAVEPDETFLVNVTNVTGASATKPQGSGTIQNDDVTVSPYIALGNSVYTQNFNSLAASGTSSETPAGWYFAESGTNADAIYTTGTGSSNAGNTYSFGAAGSSERAFGGVQSSSLVPTIGAYFQNNTGTTIEALKLTYTGEQWRLGATGRNDRLDFQWSTDATSLTTGTWTDVDQLSFVAPNSTGTAGALDGNATANRTLVSFTLTGLSIAAGETFYIRWNDPNVSGADDGLAIDDFSIEANPSDVTGPVITQLSPAGNATDVAASFTATMVFDELIQKGSGSIVVRKAADQSIVLTIPVSSAQVVVSGQSLSFLVGSLLSNTAYFIEVSNGVVKDLGGNAFLGINGSTGWAFTTGSIVYTANFNTCTSTLSDGFTQYNLTGSQTWGCSTFGRNSNGVQINGFASGAQTNDAWLISPALHLNSVANLPVLSFYSRGDFSGTKLQLYVSTTYSGSGAPNPADWTEITTANFPEPSGSSSGSWTLSDNIDLSPYKSAENVYIAFRYTSSPELNAARWAVDDIVIGDETGLINVTPLQLTFGDVFPGQHSEAQPVHVQVISTEAVVITPPAGYTVSLSNSGFTTEALTVDAETAAQGFTLYVRFSPTVKALKVEGAVSVMAGSLSRNILVSGSSYPKSETLDVGCYNLSFFGAGSSNNFTPQQRATQVANITTVMQKLKLDVYGAEEVSSDEAMSQLVANLPGYGSVLSPRWSYSFDAPDPDFPPQKIGFVYNTNTLTLSATEPPRPMFEGLYDSARLNLEGHRLTDYPGGTPSSFWASGRLPYMATFFASINGITKKIRVVVIHAKSGSTQSDYQRRLYDAQVLKDSLDFYYADDEVIVVGDYNDRMVQSIYTGSNTSPYLPFVNDEANYTVLTKPLDEAGRTSFPSSNGLIDHLIVSNEMAADYIGNSTDIEDPRAYINPYTSVTASDHLPVFARFELHPCLVAAPTAISGSAAICPAATELRYTIEPVATATTYTWTVPQGWTITAGQGTTHITVNATTSAGEISVVASNLCGSSQPAHLTIELETEKPVVTSCPMVPVQCYVAGENYTIPALTASDNCQVSDISFVISGATERTGNSANASGHFNVGISTINWTVTDVAGNTANCQTEVRVNSPLVSSVPDVYAVQPGGAANTLYQGYGPASLTLQGSVSGGTAPYTFAWTAGSASDPVLNNASSYTVSAETSVTYFFVAKDMNGCAAAPVSKPITVMDIRCGNKLDKVTLCHTGNGKAHSILCVSENAVAAHLANGAYLGSCTTDATTVKAMQSVHEAVKTNGLLVTASPNPSSHAFAIQVTSDNVVTPVQLRVMDLLGRTVETKTQVSPNSSFTIGETYKSGIYIIELQQGNTQKQVKLWKQ